MEKENSLETISDSEFLALLSLAKQHDSDAILKLLHYFEEEMIKLSQFIRIPKEDAIQSMKLEMIDLFVSDACPCLETHRDS